MRERRGWPAVVLMIVGGTFLSLVAGTTETATAQDPQPALQAPAVAPVAAPSAEPAQAPLVSNPEPHQVGLKNAEEPSPADLVSELQKRREQVELREKGLDAREAELRAREKALEEELKKIQQVRDDIARIQGARQKEDDERVAKIVETVETMSPKAAAPMLSTMDESLAVAAMAKTSTLKLAKIMNVMETKRSARLSELLAGVVRARGATEIAHTASSGAAAATKMSVKGGDRNDGQSEQSVDGGSSASRKDGLERKSRPSSKESANTGFDE
jgi:flagellar motility protein MotE (MotC chaperone)